jgi:hypothetical protein
MHDLVSISSDNLLVNRLTEHQRLHLSQRRFEDHSIRSIIPDLWQRPSLSRPNDMTFESPREKEHRSFLAPCNKNDRSTASHSTSQERCSYSVAPTRALPCNEIQNRRCRSCADPRGKRQGRESSSHKLPSAFRICPSAKLRIDHECDYLHSIAWASSHGIMTNDVGLNMCFF